MNYDELHRQRELRRYTFPTTSPTTRLHETYLSLARWQTEAVSDRPSLFAYALHAMRGLLIEYLSICPAFFRNTFSGTATERRK